MSSRSERRVVLRGTVQRLGLEGGLWALRLDDGALVELVDPPEALRSAGRRVEVEGTRRDAEVTVGMLGDAVVVTTHRDLD